MAASRPAPDLLLFDFAGANLRYCFGSRKWMFRDAGRLQAMLVLARGELPLTPGELDCRS